MHASTDRVTAPGPGPELRRRELRGPADPLSAITWLERDRLPVALAGTWSDNELVLTSEPVRIASAEEDPFDLLGSVGDAPHPGAAPGAIGGGWFGWLGFGLSRRLEELPHPPPRPRPWPDFHLALYDHVVRFDGRGWFFECLPTPAREAELDRLAALWERRLAGEPPAPEAYELGPVRPYGSGTASHRVAVEEAVERIRRGDLLQANVCMRLEGRIRGSLLSAWVRGVREARPAYAAFVGGLDRAVASLSPELFLRSRGGVVASEPIKGTAPADADPATLRASAKDRAENVMIVDLMRNDLGRVAEFGSVTVDELCEVRPAAGVWHLVSRVSARLREGATAADLLRATFPPGSVTGAPKIQALKLIAELEGTAREVYCGAIGLCSPRSGLELNVAIRTLEVTGEELSLGAGGGVVAESTGAGEVAEALTKARGVCRAVGAELIDAPATGGDARGLRWIAERPDPELGILETIAVADGRCVSLADHLARLRRSAARLGLPLPTGLEEEIEAEAAEIADGGLRIVCSRQGHEIGPRSRPEAAPVELVPVALAGGLGSEKWADRRAVDSFSAPGVAPLLVDLDGTVLEAGYAALAILWEGSLLLPPLDGRILPSISRGSLIESASRLSLDVATRSFSLQEARAADALILTSALRGPHPGILAGGPPPDRALALCEELRSHEPARLRARRPIADRLSG